MSSQKFSAYEREAIWVAHEKKCAYTREPLDVSSFHIDHVLPETLADNPAALADAIARLGLPKDFDVHGYGNLLPCRPGANLQKGTLILEPAPTLYFLGIAAAKRSAIETLLARIAKRNARGKALILLQQCLERGDLSASEVAAILERHTERPDEIFALIEGMRLFADATEVRAIARIDIETLRDRPVRLGQNAHIDGVELTNDDGSHVYVRTCREYDEAINAGFFAYSTFDIKMATFFEHQCGLLTAFQVAKQPQVSFISEPRSASST